MTQYLNPIGISKNDWLEKNALELPSAPYLLPDDDNEVYVCLVQNPGFSAAGVALTQFDLDRFTAPDTRPKKWYLANKAKVMQEVR